MIIHFPLRLVIYFGIWVEPDDKQPRSKQSPGTHHYCDGQFMSLSFSSLTVIRYHYPGSCYAMVKAPPASWLTECFSTMWYCVPRCPGWVLSKCPQTISSSVRRHSIRLIAEEATCCKLVVTHRSCPVDSEHGGAQTVVLCALPYVNRCNIRMIWLIWPRTSRVAMKGPFG